MPDVAAEFKFFVLFLVAGANYSPFSLLLCLSLLAVKQSIGDAELATERIEKVLA